MKKALPVFLSLLLAASCVACGKSPSESTQGPSNSLTAEKVELNCAVFAGSEAEENYWDSFTKRFMTAYPDYVVNFEYAAASSPEDYIKSKVAAGDFPDTMWVYQPALLIDGGVIQEIPKELEDLLLQPDAFKVGGKLYTMPMQSGALGMWYNKDIFEQAGITELPEVWPDFIEALEKISAIGIEPLGISAKDGWNVGGFFSFMWAPATYGAEPHWPALRNAGQVKYNNETTLRSLEQLAETVPYWQKGALSASADEVKSLFFTGKVAIMGNGGQYNAGEINSGEIQADFPVGFLPMPQDEADMRRVNTFSDNMFVISSEVQGAKLTAVTDLIAFFFQPESYEAYLSHSMAFPTVKGYEEMNIPMENEIASTMLSELHGAMNTLGTVLHAHAAQGDDMWPSGCREMTEKICQEIAAGNTDYGKLMDLMDEQWDKGLEQAKQK